MISILAGQEYNVRTGSDWSTSKRFRLESGQRKLRRGPHPVKKKSIVCPLYCRTYPLITFSGISNLVRRYFIKQTGGKYR
jgi:hypothetical protein